MLGTTRNASFFQTLMKGHYNNGSVSFLLARAIPFASQGFSLRKVLDKHKKLAVPDTDETIYAYLQWLNQ